MWDGSGVFGARLGDFGGRERKFGRREEMNKLCSTLSRKKIEKKTLSYIKYRREKYKVY